MANLLVEEQLMAPHTSLPAALSGLCGIAAALLLAASVIAPAPRAGDQVYIWRDQSGALRFSTVERSEPRAEAPAVCPAPADQCEAPSR